MRVSFEQHEIDLLIDNNFYFDEEKGKYCKDLPNEELVIILTKFGYLDTDMYYYKIEFVYFENNNAILFEVEHFDYSDYDEYLLHFISNSIEQFLETH